MSQAASPVQHESLPVIRPYDIAPTGSEGWFHDVLRTLSDEFVAKAEDLAGELIDGHMAFLSSGEEDAMRSRGEYAIELLSFGVLRSEYGALAASTPELVLKRMGELWESRSNDPSRKKEADEERGMIFRDLLERDVVDPGIVDDERLVDWLEGTGEFVQEALRMRLWNSSAEVFGLDEFRRVSCDLASWFVPRAQGFLGDWTRGVAAFRAHVIASGKPREDLFLITRCEALYHLNMVGSEVMNRGFLPGYAKRPDKVVLVPGCMRSRDDATCRARREGLDISCTHCHPDCEVAAIDRLAREKGFRVFVVPHASTFTAWLHHWRRDDGTSLVAVACPLHLVTGGYEMRALGLEAQCVLLEYSGCQRHWDPYGIPTRLDRKRLLEVVEGGVSQSTNGARLQSRITAGR